MEIIIGAVTIIGILLNDRLVIVSRNAEHNVLYVLVVHCSN